MTRIAWFSSITRALPLRSAAFSRAVLERIPRHWDVEIFVGDDDWAEIESAPRLYGMPVRHYLRAYLRDREAPFDVFVYQLEDQSRCRFALDSMRVYGGVACAHDISYNRIEIGRFSHNTTGCDLNREMDKQFGRKSARLGDVLVRGWPVEVYDRVYPRGADDWSQTAALVVFERRLAEIVKDRLDAGALSSTTFPLNMMTPEELSSKRSRERQAVGFGAKDFVVGYAGERPLEDRVSESVRGFRGALDSFIEKRSSSRYPHSALKLLWLTSSEQGEQNAQKELDLLAGENREAAQCVKIVRTFDVGEFQSLLCAADVYSALHVHEYHGIPAPTYWSMSYGIPCVLAGIEDDTTFPAQVAAALPVGGNEAAALTSVLVEMMSNPAYREHLARNARAYVQSCCDPALVVQDLQHVFTEYRGRIRRDAQARHARYVEAESDYLESLKAGDAGIDSKSDSEAFESSADSVVSRASRDFSWGAPRGDR